MLRKTGGCKAEEGNLHLVPVPRLRNCSEELGQLALSPGGAVRWLDRDDDSGPRFFKNYAESVGTVWEKRRGAPTRGRALAARTSARRARNRG